MSNNAVIACSAAVVVAMALLGLLASIVEAGFYGGLAIMLLILIGGTLVFAGGLSAGHSEAKEAQKEREAVK